VRLHPKDAIMTTYTYEPLTGMTSMTDARGMITYYEYDEMQRLTTVRDFEKNILKQICYNYAGQAVDCLSGSNVVLYVNQPISQVFTRDNCSPGQHPVPYTYTIPAGWFTSTISQADADARAQEELEANGQKIANTVPCEYQSQAISQNYIKNDCIGTGSSVPFYLPQGYFTSTISQSEADSQAQAHADIYGQQNANEQGTCTGASIYARVEMNYVYYTATNDGSTVVSKEFYRAQIKFYADENCTVPYTLTNNANFKIRMNHDIHDFDGEFYYDYEDQIYEGISGSNYIDLGDIPMIIFKSIYDAQSDTQLYISEYYYPNVIAIPGVNYIPLPTID